MARRDSRGGRRKIKEKNKPFPFTFASYIAEEDGESFRTVVQGHDDGGDQRGKK
jgi:hypothetical protein